ncbi:MAG TPA: pectinesterase family protein [Gemmatimonadaceae bacterium]|nr:pectinesterase family protein [Gemmatimonadaceae bacterium]
MRKTPPWIPALTRLAVLASLASVAPVASLASVASAQDARTVTEPKVPAACTVLGARLVPVADTTLAEADEGRLDTKRIQDAIDRCAAGRAVVLRASASMRAFLSGPLRLRRGVTLVVDTGAILFASRDPNLYDLDHGRCGTVDERGHACRPFISADTTEGVGVMGPGTIDGRGWAKLLGKDVSWWDLAQDAKFRNLSQSCPRLIQFTRSNDVTLYDVTIRNSPNFHVVFDRGNGFTAWSVRIDTRDPRARNTDGIDPVSATNVTVTHSFINTGDDNVVVKAGKVPSSNVTVSHNHFYRGHGMSIGSETDGGAHAIRVFDLSIDGADNGLRIKSNASRGGRVEDVEYRDICIRNTRNVIEMDTHYSASPQTTGNLIPQYSNIRLRDVRVSGAGKVILDGYDKARPLGIIFDNVTFDNPAAIAVNARHVALTRGPGPMNLQITGDDVLIAGTSSDAPVNSCAGKFVPMPTGARAAGGPSYAAIVDARFGGADGERVDGAPTFRSLGAALTSLPPNGVGRATILIRNGRYHEKLTIDRPYVTLVGQNRDSTVLTYDAAADTPSPGGGTYGTRGSFTLRIVAPDFRAAHLTIENAFDYPANAAKPDTDRTKLRNQQAVALMTDLGSDRAVFTDVRVTGYQDTLFPNSGRSYFHECEIRGHVDFIFGAGQAVFDDCDIVSRDRGSTANNGYITAASTDTSQPYGFLFIRSQLRKERQQMAANSVTLGRPWHPFANPRAIGSVVFMNCWMDDHIGDRGWDRMSSVDSTGTRIWYEPSSARFFEYETTGPGAVKGPARRLLTPEEARQYTPASVLGGWIPALPGAR